MDILQNQGQSWQAYKGYNPLLSRIGSLDDAGMLNTTRFGWAGHDWLGRWIASFVNLTWKGENQVIIGVNVVRGGGGLRWQGA